MAKLIFSPRMDFERQKSRLWKGCFPEQAAENLRIRYGFRQDFDLGDRLSEITWRYLRRSKISPDAALNEARSSMDAARLSNRVQSQVVRG